MDAWSLGGLNWAMFCTLQARAWKKAESTCWCLPHVLYQLGPYPGHAGPGSPSSIAGPSQPWAPQQIKSCAELLTLQLASCTTSLAFPHSSLLSRLRAHFTFSPFANCLAKPLSQALSRPYLLVLFCHRFWYSEPVCIYLMALCRICTPYYPYVTLFSIRADSHSPSFARTSPVRLSPVPAWLGKRTTQCNHSANLACNCPHCFMNSHKTMCWR